MENCRIAFPLDQDEDGYPPYKVETVWAVPLGEGRYQIDNVPYFVLDLADQDIVCAVERDGRLWFEYLYEYSDHSTVRVVAPGDAHLDEVTLALANLGCHVERLEDQHFLAVDVPPEVGYKLVQALLAEGEHAGKWEYQESAIRHPR